MNALPLVRFWPGLECFGPRSCYSLEGSSLEVAKI